MKLPLRLLCRLLDLEEVAIIEYYLHSDDDPFHGVTLEDFGRAKTTYKRLVVILRSGNRLMLKGQDCDTFHIAFMKVNEVKG